MHAYTGVRRSVAYGAHSIPTVHAHLIYLSPSLSSIPLLRSFSLSLSRPVGDRFDEIPRSGALVAPRATCSPSVVMNRAAEEVLASRPPPSSS